MKKVLITGAGSYIGTYFMKWAAKNYPTDFCIFEIEMKSNHWKRKNFSNYDTVFHVAGIAHADISSVSETTKELYYSVNRDLAIETALKAKAEGVKQFIFMSSMIIYGDEAKRGNEVITRETQPCPANFYGDSKWQADRELQKLQTSEFQVAVLRPPMIYGKGSKGNYATLSQLAKKLPMFPNIKNKRSMLHIDNLCELLVLLIKSGDGGVYFPQNKEYVITSHLVKKIAEVAGHRIWVTKLLNPIVSILGMFPGKVSKIVNKAFGSFVYDFNISNHFDGMYQKNKFEKTIVLTERRKT